MNAAERARPIRLVGFDVDGVLTDGRLYYSANDAETKAFHVLDGMGLQLLAAADIEVCVISARSSPAAARRLAELGVRRTLLGTATKRPAFERLQRELGLDYSQCAYMGDDLPDLAILARVGLAATVSAAFPTVRERCHWVATRPAGAGAVREFIEFLLQAQGCLERLTAPYLELEQ